MSADLQRRVLVVETVPRGTEELRQALSGEGYYVALATGATEAMRIVGTGSPDAVIVDLPACEETAKAFTRRLREKQTQHLPLLVLSPGDSVRDSVAGGAAGSGRHSARRMSSTRSRASPKSIRLFSRKNSGFWTPA